MTESEPDLPFPPLNNPLRTATTVDGKKVVASASLALERNATVEITIEDLTFVLAFDGKAGTGIEFDIRDGKLHAVFPNTDAPLGASISPIDVATLNGRPLYLGVYHQTIASTGRLVVYTLLMGDVRGQ